MYLYFSENEIIEILKCINITMGFMREHTRDEKKFIQFYFDFNDYYENYDKLLILHRLISLKANKHFYNIDDNFFIKREKKKNIFSKVVDKFRKVV